MNYTFQWGVAFKALPQMLQGALVTLEIAAVSMLCGTLLAIALATMSGARSRIARLVAAAWIETARNTPALFQIYMVYFGLGSFGLRIESLFALAIGITFNNAGYLAESFRGGLNAIPETQTRAARSLGMRPVTVFVSIILPQLLRIVFHPLVNQMIWAILMTSLGVVVGLTNDLMGVTQRLNVLTFRTFEFFTIAAVIYYCLAKLVHAGSRLLAYKLLRY